MNLYYDPATGIGLYTGENIDPRPEPSVAVPDRIAEPWAWRVNNGVATYDEALARAEWRETAEMDRATFAVAAFVAGWLSEDDAEAWGAGGELPEAVADEIADCTADPVGALKARIAARSGPTLARNGAAILAFQAGLEIADEDVDAVFGFVPSVCT